MIQREILFINSHQRRNQLYNSRVVREKSTKQLVWMSSDGRKKS